LAGAGAPRLHDPASSRAPLPVPHVGRQAAKTWRFARDSNDLGAAGIRYLHRREVVVARLMLRDREGKLVLLRRFGMRRLARMRALPASTLLVLAWTGFAFAATESSGVVFNTPGLSQAATVALDDAGSVFVAWEERAVEQLLFSRSTDAATTFTTPVPVVPGAAWLSFGQVRMTSLRASDVRMAFTAFDTLYGGAEIVYAGSTDGGDSFPDAEVVSAIDASNSFVPDIAAGWGIAIAWSNDDLAGTTSVEWSLSSDEGDTFSPPRRLDVGEHNVSCPDIALFGDGTAYAAWWQNDDPFGADEAAEIFFSRSVDGGETFSQPLNISNTPEKSWCPRMAVDETGAIYLVWTDGPAFGGMKLSFAVSKDGGETFSAPRMLATVPEGKSLDGTIAAAGDGNLWATWSTWDAGSQYESFLARSTDAGETFFEAPIPGSFNQIAAKSADEIYTVWHEAAWDGPLVTADVYASRGIVAACGDANGDGTITASDALIGLKTAVGSDACTPAICDVDGSGAITAADALAMLRVAVGLPVSGWCLP
jgi:hypothetical protein